jgi:hypothetical protein
VTDTPNIDETIIQFIERVQGCKASRLAAAAAMYPQTAKKYMEGVDSLVSRGELIEVEYILPGTDRVKSFLLPKGTIVRVVKESQ